MTAEFKKILQQQYELFCMKMNDYGKGKRGGLRIIYYWWVNEYQIYLFTIYNKNECTELSHDQKKELRELLEDEIKARSQHEKT